MTPKGSSQGGLPDAFRFAPWKMSPAQLRATVSSSLLVTTQLQETSRVGGADPEPHSPERPAEAQVLHVEAGAVSGVTWTKQLVLQKPATTEACLQTDYSRTHDGRQWEL